MLLRRARLWVLLCSGILLTGCSTWVRQEPTPEVTLRERTPQLIRITLTSGRIVELANPRASRDSLSGVLPHSSSAGAPLRTFQIPLDSVRSMAVRERSFARTVSLAVLAPSLVAGSLFLMGF